MQASDYYGYGDYKDAARSMFLSNRIEIPHDVKSQHEVRWTLEQIMYRPGVTSVWGIAGVGKSTLVRECYDHFREKLITHDIQRSAWVDVPDPFNLVEFSRLLLLDFHRPDLEAMEAAAIGIMQGQDPIQPTTKTKIVIITTEESIAEHGAQQQIINPELLAHLNGKVDLAKLVAKCGGLPKVVSAMGKPLNWLFWEDMNDDFMLKLETDPQFHSLRGLLSWMHSYFDSCSDLVKPCILYLSVFPASSKIRRGRLVRRWIAEGYSRDTLGCTARENAQNRLSELVKLSIIQQVTNNNICQVNGFFREYIVSRPMEDNLVFALDGRCSPNTQPTGQHLTIMTNWQRDKNVFEGIDFARLRSLTIFGAWCSFFISIKMKRLRVLDLEDMIAIKDDDIEQIFLNLLSLKFISLRGCRNISRLPDTLGGLRQLQTLDVRFTSIVMLPSSIIKLQKLQYIHAGTVVLPDDDWTSASSEDGDGVTSQLPTATSAELEGRDSSISSGWPIVQPSPEICITESSAQAATSSEAQHCSMLPKVGWASKQSRTSVVPRLPKFAPITWSLCGSRRDRKTCSVKVPVGIEKLVALHTLGVVNVNAAGGEAFLKQLAKLTQLLKLRVCGINKKNWQLLCSALSDKNCHLESLSVRFDEDCLDDSFKPPETLKSLKLYGPIRKLPDTIKGLLNIRKVDLDMTITRPFDMHLFLKDKLPLYGILNRLCIKVQGDHKIDFSEAEFNYLDRVVNVVPRVLKMDCSSQLEVSLDYHYISRGVLVLIIQCSKGSFFRVSGIFGLSSLPHLKTVWLKGSYSEEQQAHLQELVDGHDKKPVLKLEPLQ
ncbi:disease resistance protein Pik-2-like [Triticum aestivum]|uniref:disease resistance protein Pik-2-like n=1 Tax=Triticum aestivum TaxID=4565 RepID=UPI001D00462B|nr:disease resistance protein Pik-2-like [Triticum aestivum]